MERWLHWLNFTKTVLTEICGFINLKYRFPLYCVWDILPIFKTSNKINLVVFIENNGISHRCVKLPQVATNKINHWMLYNIFTCQFWICFIPFFRSLFQISKENIFPIQNESTSDSTIPQYNFVTWNHCAGTLGNQSLSGILTTCGYTTPGYIDPERWFHV